ncbi:RtcB family protein [Candidatus Parcubacteria bacterium]|nr:MAG: RtcB family protein [Candidatus Parcubacteria bacterium]
MIDLSKLKKLSNYLWEVPGSFRGDMRVPARIYATEKMLKKIGQDRSLDQLINVTTLPGVYKYCLAMPDMHEGYGFPIGGVAAVDAENGIISPGGVGYDINCGVRLLTGGFNFDESKDLILDLANQIQRDVPSGVGRGGKIKLDKKEIDEVLKNGALWAVYRGYGEKRDLEFTEEEGRLKNADPEFVFERAKKRGQDQVGTLGAGNHFLEIQKVEAVYDNTAAQHFELKKNQIVFMIHTGSRGLGHQVCTDYVRILNKEMPSDIRLPDRELVCAYFNSEQGQSYFKAMSAAANFAWANRQMISHWVRNSVKQILQKKSDLDYNLKILYDVAHNIAKQEIYDGKEYIVHRKGATRCFGPGRIEVPEKYRSIGQPVIIPGSMGTASYVLSGTNLAMSETFGSACHGAGRQMSRKKAVESINYNALKTEMSAKKIITRAGSARGLVEEAPQAYKDIDEVVDVVHNSGIAKKVARLVPLAVIKG